VKIILTNDDGIEAPGIKALYSALQEFGTPIVVAPETQQSGVGHQITLDSTIRVNEIEEGRFSVSGTPADCTRIALNHIAPDACWVFSGINSGANLGTDVYVSGTVAAVREAAFHGCRGMALSQYISQDHEIDWDITRHQVIQLIRYLIEHDLDPGHFWNVNLPHPFGYETKLETKFCDLDKNPHAFSFDRKGNELAYVSNFHERPRHRGLDVDVCFSGKVSISRIAI